ncbi:flagellar basal body P-ring formation protein FlgA [Paraneptunicella aestuarii]|uniref:flagellar basal body P-ring formation chaperone FlgA n=1 Tax=Paraneptunicella aestuarii TaxID=2831148 RepID=UPI001E2B35B7|nr:flagellar basal body P-ring formation chaperone FlgA [Paraneptunicella aestuarii]UAA37598.1 flagellar basal body P-ring formation protein FlgA [Paraneptunicella aestuarii]
MLLLITFLQKNKLLPCCMALSVFTLSLSAQAMSFQKSINRLQAPVMVTDVLQLQASERDLWPNDVLNTEWPESLQGWVTQEQVVEWAKTKGVTTESLTWKGIKKSWLQWCYPVSLTDSQAMISQEIQSSLPGYLILNSLQVDERTIPCIEEQAKGVRVVNVSTPGHEGIEVQLSIETSSGTYDAAAQYDAQFSAKALKLNAKAAMNTPLNKLDLSHVRVPWRGDKLITESELEKYQLVKQLSKGYLLSHRDVIPIPLVAQGEWVKVTLSHGAIQISTQGVAMSSGNHGEEISVKVQDSPRTSKATVVAKGVVNVSV